MLLAAGGEVAIHDPYRGPVRKFPTALRDAAGQEMGDLARIEDRNGNWIEFIRDGERVATEAAHSGDRACRAHVPDLFALGVLLPCLARTVRQFALITDMADK
jgi:hypothetical protein